MAEIKIDIRTDEKSAKYVYGMLKNLASNKKTQLNVVYDPKGLEWSTITGILGDDKFVIQPEYTKNNGVRTIYHVHVGGYEVDFEEEYDTGFVNGKVTKLIQGLRDKIREDFILDQNTMQYLPRPKQPNFFQRLFGRSK